MSIRGHFDEGLGTVYERFMLNSFFNGLIDSHKIEEVLEVPIYGMTGLIGINSVHLAQRGCNVTLMDSKEERIEETVEMWKVLPYGGRHEVLYHKDLSKLPFDDNRFDLVWNFAALWHVRDADLLLCEMARVSSNLILVLVPNKKQIGYLLRKYFLDKEFFNLVDESWAEIERVISLLSSLGLKMRDRGVLDVPPWPDTCMPIGQLLGKLKIRRNGDRAESNTFWNWDIMSYYLGKDPTLKQRVERFSIIERMPIPWQLKTLWAHHTYVIFSKN